MKKIAIICGGYSSEFDISIKSANTILAHFPEGYDAFLIELTKDNWTAIYQGQRLEVDPWNMDFQVDGKTINSFLDLNSIIATKRPNDVVKVILKRNNDEKEVLVTLSKKELAQINFNGFEIENLTQQEQKNLGINYGVKINGISNPRFKRYENELKNAVVLAINGHKIANTESANEILSKLNDQQLRIDLITPRGERLRLIL